eukprot:scaffold9559_cov101-Isochrysis_galbana.AAC.13
MGPRGVRVAGRSGKSWLEASVRAVQIRGGDGAQRKAAERLARVHRRRATAAHPKTAVHESDRACARISLRISDHQPSRMTCCSRDETRSLTDRAETTPPSRTCASGRSGVGGKVRPGRARVHKMRAQEAMDKKRCSSTCKVDRCGTPPAPPPPALAPPPPS